MHIMDVVTRPCLIFIVVISHMLIMDDFFSVNVAGDNFSSMHHFSLHVYDTFWLEQTFILVIVIITLFFYIY